MYNQYMYSRKTKHVYLLTILYRKLDVSILYTFYFHTYRPNKKAPLFQGITLPFSHAQKTIYSNYSTEHILAFDFFHLSDFKSVLQFSESYKFCSIFPPVLPLLSVLLCFII